MLPNILRVLIHFSSSQDISRPRRARQWKLRSDPGSESKNQQGYGWRCCCLSSLLVSHNVLACFACARRWEAPVCSPMEAQSTTEDNMRRLGRVSLGAYKLAVL